MSQSNTHDAFRLGFLASIELPGRGHIGGLLVTNQLGRPLEFQCTAPIKANRTQEILYGPTLVPYLLCDLIGRTLVERVGVKPHLVLVDDTRLLELREQAGVSVAVLVCSEHTGSGIQHPVSRTQYTVLSPEYPALSTRCESADVDRSMVSEPPRESRSHPMPLVVAERTGPPTFLGRHRITLHPAFSADAAVLDEARRRLPDDADLREPFQRVREALRETMGAAA